MNRVLCIVGSMNAGGAETFLMKMYRKLDKNKYQMDFAVAIVEKGFYDDEIIKMGGKIFNITPKSKGILQNFVDIKQLVKNGEYQYVLRISQHSLSALELLAAKLGGAKVRVFRSSNSNTTTGSKKQLVLHKICMFMPKYFANVRIAPSTEAAEYMFGKHCVKNGRAKLLHNAVDTTIYCYDEIARKSLRAEFGFNDNDFIIGHIGRFNQQKNHKFLIKIFNEVHKKRSDSYLVLVGSGELENQVKEQIKKLGIENNVIFAGLRNDVPKILSAFDMFLLPSLYEGMPNTVIEAQATGLPCVIADTITKEADITGLVSYLPLKDEAKWANVLLKCSSLERNRITKEYFVRNKYDIDSTVVKFEAIVFKGDS